MLLVLYDPIEYWVLIPKMIEIILFIILAVKIRQAKDYTLNKIIFTAFLLWAIYIILNSVIYLIAANGEFEFQIATIFHRIGVSIAIIFALLVFITALVVKHGYMAFELKTFYFSVIITIVMCILALTTQNIMIVDPAGNELLTIEEWNAAEFVRVSIPIGTITIILTLFPIIFYIIAIVYLLSISKFVEPSVKQRMNYLILGYLALFLGFMYFLLIQMLEAVNIITGTIGHLIWTISPILIWKSQKKE